MPACWGFMVSRASGRRAVDAAEDSLDVVPVGVEHERSVVAAAVVRPRTWRAVVLAAVGERRLEERVHSLLVVSHEREMDLAARGVRDTEVEDGAAGLVEADVATALAAAYAPAEWREARLVERPRLR